MSAGLPLTSNISPCLPPHQKKKRKKQASRSAQSLKAKTSFTWEPQSVTVQFKTLAGLTSQICETFPVRDTAGECQQKILRTQKYHHVIRRPLHNHEVRALGHDRTDECICPMDLLLQDLLYEIMRLKKEDTETKISDQDTEQDTSRDAHRNDLEPARIWLAGMTMLTISATILQKTTRPRFGRAAS